MTTQSASIDIPVVETFTAAALQTTFQLTSECNAGDLTLSVNGVSYVLGTDYTVNSVTSVVTWLDTDFALEAGDVVVVEYWPLVFHESAP